MSSAKPAPAAPAPLARERDRAIPPDPAFRRLRGYAIDPSLSGSLETVRISEMNFEIPWESLNPGPAGEYLEVVDVDPASGSFYEPVNLDDAKLLAQNGLPVSEGSPQFHQQMVYAVASLTIHNFEHALGRRALWRPGPPPAGASPYDDSHYVRRLRIYPHALRERNAYYSPQRVALLFGYFNATADDRADHMPGSMVFTCLSHDIVAHETTHALLDGMHRRFMQATNPDVLAFHEAFADIVALFQHFTFPEILRHQMASTRGEIRSQESFLGQLAGQFGRSTGLRGALRDAIGKRNDQDEWQPSPRDPMALDKTEEPHDRGAILVAAVFDAFLSIYERRTSDLVRLATGGSGVLRPGAIHPDLVNRLAHEAAKSAQHVLNMCIRALDYCPPTDLTFGEYLRAIITADFDLVVNDDLHYRVAFVEAFRRRGIYPRDLRSLSVESLRWGNPRNDARPPSEDLEKRLEQLREDAEKQMYARSREDVFTLQRSLRINVHDWLADHFATNPAGKADAVFLGLDPNAKFEVHTARFAYRSSPDGDVNPQVLIGLLQFKKIPLDPHDPGGEQVELEGGSTIVADLRTRTIRYCVRKKLIDENGRVEEWRVAPRREYLARTLASTRYTYQGMKPLAGTNEPFAMMHRGSFRVL